jgi:hypothetical protein
MFYGLYISIREKLLRNPIFDEVYILGFLKNVLIEQRKLPGTAVIRNSRLPVAELMHFNKIIIRKFYQLVLRQ